MPKPKQPTLLEQIKDKLPFRKKVYPCKASGTGSLYKRHRFITGGRICIRCWYERKHGGRMKPAPPPPPVIGENNHG